MSRAEFVARLARVRHLRSMAAGRPLPEQAAHGQAAHLAWVRTLPEEDQ